MFLFGGYSDKGALNEIWSLSAKEILGKDIINNKEAGKRGKKFIIWIEELQLLLRKQFEEFELVKRAMTEEIKQLHEVKQPITESIEEIRQYEPTDFEV